METPYSVYKTYSVDRERYQVIIGVSYLWEIGQETANYKVTKVYISSEEDKITEELYEVGIVSGIGSFSSLLRKLENIYLRVVKGQL